MSPSPARRPKPVSTPSVATCILTLNSDRVRAESVSGDLTLRGRMNGEVDVETVSGRIDVAVLQNRLQRLSGRRCRATSASRPPRQQWPDHAGNGQRRPELVMPRDLSANVRGESFSGDLTAPGAQVIRPKHGPGSSFEHRYGSGDGDISIETFSGNARLRLDN